MSRKFKFSFYRKPGHLAFDIFCSIFPNTDPSKSSHEEKLLPNVEKSNNFLLTLRNWLLVEYRTLLLLNPYTIKKEKQCISSIPLETMYILHFLGGPTKYIFLPYFYRKIFIPSPLWFLKNFNSSINKDGGGVHSL